jgi:hypothetical protein
VIPQHHSLVVALAAMALNTTVRTDQGEEAEAEVLKTALAQPLEELGEIMVVVEAGADQKVAPLVDQAETVAYRASSLLPTLPAQATLSCRKKEWRSCEYSFFKALLRERTGRRSPRQPRRVA